MAFRAPNFDRRWMTLGGSDVDLGHSQPIITFCSNSFFKPVKMTQHVSIKSHFFNQKPYGICNFEEQFVFAFDSIKKSFDIRNVPHTCKVTIITSRPPLTSPDPTQTSHINPHLIHVNMLTLPKLSKMKRVVSYPFPCCARERTS